MRTFSLPWPGDLPVCFPGRRCVDQSPLAADLINATSALTPSSPAIAALCFTALGAALVLVGLGLRMQRRGPGVRPWLAVLVTVLLLLGAILAFTVDSWFGAISSIYSDLYGQPTAVAPASLTGAWPSVLVAGRAMMALAAVTIVAMLSTAARQHRRRAAG